VGRNGREHLVPSLGKVVHVTCPRDTEPRAMAPAVERLGSDSRRMTVQGINGSEALRHNRSAPRNRRMVVGSIESGNTKMIKGLVSEGPDPELKEKLTLFGQFVGDWEIDCQSLQSDGKWIKTKGEVHFGWILNGKALQDVWITRTENPAGYVTEGTTLRFYDPNIDAWQCIWIAPARGTVRTFVARQVGDEIVLEGTTKDGFPERWTYSEIRPRSFRWRATRSHDSGKTWQLTEEMQIRRS